MTLAGFVLALDYASALIFALTGALVASRKQLDLTGFVFMAALTAVGGGTLRDLMLDRAPLVWIARPSLIVMAAAAAVLVFWTAHLLESRAKALLWLDAFALAIAVAAGVGVAIGVGVSPVIVVLMGIATGCFGGLMRDVVGNEVPVIFRQGELYITAALGGAATAVLLIWLGLSQQLALLTGAAVVLALRIGSMIWGWALPLYKPMPPREKR